LIDSEGEQVGVVSRQDALQSAAEVGLDLVEISPTAKPPVCRIMDFGKFKYEQSKKQAAAKKKQQLIQIKEIKFRPTTEKGDYQIKLRKLIVFLEHGDKVKVTLRFRGREMAHQGIGLKLLQRLVVDLEQHGTVEQMPKLEGRQLVMLVTPNKK